MTKSEIPEAAVEAAFDKWHDEREGECPVCNPHTCDDYCQHCEEL